MPAPSSSRRHRIDDAPLMADGCVGDEGKPGLHLCLGARHRRPEFSPASPWAGRTGTGSVPRHHRAGRGIPVFVGNAGTWKSARARLSAHAVRLADQHLAVRSALRPRTRPTPARWRSCLAIPLTGSTGCGRWCGTPARCRFSTLARCRAGPAAGAKSMLTAPAACPRASGRPSARHRRADADQVLGGLIRSGRARRRTRHWPRHDRSKRWLESSLTGHARARPPLPHSSTPGDSHGCSAARPQFRQNGTSHRMNPRSKEHSPHWRPPNHRTGPRILDPCAGEGVAIAEAAHALGREQVRPSPSSTTPSGTPCPATGRSLHPRRPDGHADLRQSFGCCGSTRRMATCPGCQRQHRLSGPGPRPAGKLFYQRALPLLQYGGVLIFIVPPTCSTPSWSDG